jgi:outer membrane protein assembly factor BamB
MVAIAVSLVRELNHESHVIGGGDDTMRTHRGNVVVIALACVLLFSVPAVARDWPQWGGQDGRNMASEEKGLPETFVPGKKDPQGGEIDPATTEHVKWVRKLGSMTCSTPAVSNGRVFVGTCRDSEGALLCLDEQTGKTLWEWSAPPREVPKEIDGRKFWFGVFPKTLGLCSSPTVDGERVYVVTHRCEALCMSAADGRVLWLFDMYEYGVRPSDACNSAVTVCGDLVYLGTCNGVDRDADAKKKDEFRRPPAPNAPNLVALDKRTGRLVAVDEAPIAKGMLHGQWSSPALGRVGGKNLVFYGGGDGVCYAFEALTSVPNKTGTGSEPASGGANAAASGEVPVPVLSEPAKLKTVWSFDGNPPEYKQFGELDLFAHYARGDKRRTDTIIGKNDGTFVGMSEIIATPVVYNGRVYVANGRDPEHGRGRGALHCIDPTKTGDITTSGRVWTYQGLDRTLSTVSIADGLLYILDVAGRVHCLEAGTGRCRWIHETQEQAWGSTLVADGKLYVPTAKHLWILAAGPEKKVLGQINLGAPLWASPVAANGVLFVTSKNYIWAVRP